MATRNNPYHSALRLIRASELAKAIELLRSVCSNPSAEPKLFRLLGRALLMNAADSEEHAREAFKRAASEALHASPKELVEIAAGLAAVQEYDLAASFYQRALELGGDEAETLGCLGFVRGMLGDNQGQLDAYSRASALEPEVANWYLGIGAALASLWRLEEAAAAYETGISLDPTDLDIRYNLSLLQAQIARRDEQTGAPRICTREH